MDMDLKSRSSIFQDIKTIYLRVNMLSIVCSFLFIISSFGDGSPPAPSGGITQGIQAYGTEDRALISGPDDSDDYSGTTPINRDAVIDRFHKFYLRGYIAENHEIRIRKNYGITLIAERAFQWDIDMEVNEFYQYRKCIQIKDFSLGCASWWVYIKFLFQNRKKTHILQYTFNMI